MNISSGFSFLIFLKSKSVSIEPKNLQLLINPMWSTNGETYGFGAAGFESNQISLFGKEIIWTKVDEFIDFYIECPDVSFYGKHSSWRAIICASLKETNSELDFIQYNDVDVTPISFEFLSFIKDNGFDFLPKSMRTYFAKNNVLDIRGSKAAPL